MVGGCGWPKKFAGVPISSAGKHCVATALRCARFRASTIEIIARPKAAPAFEPQRDRRAGVPTQKEVTTPARNGAPLAPIRRRPEGSTKALSLAQPLQRGIDFINSESESKLDAATHLSSWMSDCRARAHPATMRWLLSPKNLIAHVRVKPALTDGLSFRLGEICR
jgi:hypothetical protein